jgi:hypothetical protein
MIRLSKMENFRLKREDGLTKALMRYSKMHTRAHWEGFKLRIHEDWVISLTTAIVVLIVTESGRFNIGIGTDVQVLEMDVLVHLEAFLVRRASKSNPLTCVDYNACRVSL